MSASTTQLPNQYLNELSVEFKKTFKTGLNADGKLQATKTFLTWFQDWITKGDQNEIQQKITAAKSQSQSIFEAHQESQAYKDSITDTMTKLVDRLQTNLNYYGEANLPSLVRSALNIHNRQDESQTLTSLAEILGSKKFTGDKDTNPALMKMNFLLLIQQAKKEGFTDEGLEKLLIDNSHKFTPEFIKQTTADLSKAAQGLPLEYAFHDQRINQVGKALADSVTPEEFAELQSKVKSIKPETYQKALKLLGQTVTADENLRAAHFKTLCEAKDTSEEVRIVLKYAAKNAELTKSNKASLSSFEDLIQKINSDSVIKLITTMVLGYFGGSLFGNSGLGILGSLLLNFISSGDEQAQTLSFAEAKKQRATPPPPKANAA